MSNAPPSVHPVPAGCPWADCWCRAWPPLRLIHSTGAFYTVDEVGPGLFRYRYITSDQQAATS